MRTARGLTGAQAATEMLRGAGISDVQVVPTNGFLSDHYNPANKTLALSEATYASNSVAAVGVACHEAGHALQHAQGYKPLGLRSALVPTASFGSSASYFVVLGGMLFHSANLVYLGALLFSAVLLFQVVTLPVEFDATARAKRLAVETGIILPQERRGDGQGPERGGDDLRGGRGLDADDPALLPAARLVDVAALTGPS